MNNFKWENLEVFTITSATGTGNVYANGRQQAKLRITLRATDINNDPVPMSSDELDSLQLIDMQGRLIDADPLDFRHASPHNNALLYNPDVYDRVAAKQVSFDPAQHDRLQFNKYSRNVNGMNWVWSRHHNAEYKFYPRAPHEQEPRAVVSRQDQHTYVIDVYVRTISNTPLVIAAQLTRRDGLKVSSHLPLRDKGTLTLHPVRAPGYAASHYSFTRHVISGNVDDKQFHDSLDYYSFGLIANQEKISFLRFDMTPKSIRRDAISPKERGSITGYTEPDEVSFNYGMNLRDLPLYVDNGMRGPGKIYVCLVRRNRLISHSSANRTISTSSNLIPLPGVIFDIESVSRGPATVRALDMYGNDHVLRLQFKGNGRNNLELA